MSVDHATAPLTTVRPPGSQGEHLLQSVYGSGERADRLYHDQVCHRLLPTMVEFVARMEMMFVAKGGDYFGAAAEPKSWNSRPQ